MTRQGSQSGHSAGGYASQTASRARSAASGAASTARRTTHALYDSARHSGETVRHSASYMSTAAHRATESLQSGYAYGRDRLWSAVDDYPLLMGGVALGVGFAMGMLLPRTHREDRLVGQTSDQIKRRAREAGRETWQRGRHAAEEAVSVISREIKEQGLTYQSVKKQAQDFASHAASDVAADVVRGRPEDIMKDLKEDAEEAGLTPHALKEKATEVASKARDAAQNEISGGSSKKAGQNGGSGKQQGQKS